MSWFFLSLTCAILTATTATLSKVLLQKRDEFFVGWIRFAVSLPLLFVVLSVSKAGCCLSCDFWKVVAITFPLELVAFLLFLKALKFSPLSLTFPFLGLTPVFTILSSFIILKEKVSLLGAAGILLVTLGAYLLNANTIKEGVLQPIKSIYREKGSMLMVLVAFIYGTTSVFGKKAVLLSNPITFSVVYCSLFFVLLALPALAKYRKTRRRLGKQEALLALGLGISFAMAIMLHFKAISIVNVSYMISVKRLSLIISVLYGALVFGEKHIRCRILGSAVMVGGVLLLSLA